MISLGMTYNSLTPIDYKLNDNGVRTIKIRIGEEEKEYCLISVNVYSHPNYDGRGWAFPGSGTVYSYQLDEIIKVKLPSKEEIAAEQSVAKAKEALKAAENALKVLTIHKEKK